MKKIWSVMLVLCMLMTAASAMAAANGYQDGAAPELVMVSDGQGGSAVAVIRDAEGNILAVIPSGNMLKLICVGERELVEDEAVAGLLENGLATLQNSEYRVSAPEQVNTDLFHAQIPAEYAEYFANGAAYLDMAFVIEELLAGDKLQVLHSVDGETWTEVTNVTYAGDGTVHVGIQQSGLVAFVVERGAVFTDDDDDAEVKAEEGTEEQEEQQFTPSVSGELAPEIVEFEDEGEDCVATIINSDKEKLASVPAKKWIVVTPLAEREDSPCVVTYEHLEWAYGAILDAENIGSLPSDDQTGTLAAAIEGMLEGTGLTIEDMTVSDLFKVVAYGEYLQLLNADEGNMLEITFDKGVEPGDKLIVLCSSEIGFWHVMDEDQVTVHADGTLTIRMKHDGVIAFLVEKDAAAVDAAADGVVSAP